MTPYVRPALVAATLCVATAVGAQTAPAPDDHAQHQHEAAAASSGQGRATPAEPLPASVPPLTDDDRRAAFPEVPPHVTDDNAVHTFLLADHLEWGPGGGTATGAWDARGWVGTDRTRMWLRTTGEGSRAQLDGADVQVLYGRMVARWWDVVGGVRQDLRPGDPQTWAAIGLQGLAPYWFDVEATAFVGAGGRTQVRLKTEYELLITNRLVLQPAVELEANGTADAARLIGAGLSRVDVGLRWRYELRREFAPYVGVQWDRRLFGSADMARRAGASVADARAVVGVRVWH